MKKIILIISITTIAGCASYFKRKECESQNWFEYGKSIALRGEWPNADKLLIECRKAGAEIEESQLDQGFKNGVQRYCNPDQAYLTGKSGEQFSRDLCDGPSLKQLLSRHSAGVNDYCAKSNGQTVGTSGKKYSGICPKDLESEFLKEYRKGRKHYVTSLIQTKNEESRELETQIESHRQSLRLKQIQAIGMDREVTNLQAQIQTTNIANTAQISGLNSILDSRRTELMTLRSRISNDEMELNRLQSNRTSILNLISELKTELPSLD